MAIQPMGNKILFKQKVLEGSEETTKSGLIVAREEEKKFPMGEVKAIGDKVEHIQVGDIILFEGWNGEAIHEDLAGEKNMMLIGAEKIIAKIV